jgi:hypothetical protein
MQSQSRADRTDKHLIEDYLRKGVTASIDAGGREQWVTVLLDDDGSVKALRRPGDSTYASTAGTHFPFPISATPDPEYNQAIEKLGAKLDVQGDSWAFSPAPPTSIA